MNTERETMKQETITVAVRIPIEDYKILMAQVDAGNFKRMSDVIRGCVTYTIKQLMAAPTEGNNNESK